MASDAGGTSNAGLGADGKAARRNIRSPEIVPVLPAEDAPSAGGRMMAMNVGGTSNAGPRADGGEARRNIRSPEIVPSLPAEAAPPRGGRIANNAGGARNAGPRADGGAARRNTNRPKYSKFTQQELPSSKLILTPKLVVSVFLIVGVLCVAIGIAALQAAENVVEIVYRYDDACVPTNMIDDKVGYIQDESVSKDCIKTLNVTKDMKQPILVYYELENFYQNHRRYVKSRSDAQLGDPKKTNETKSCGPESTANGKPIVPCGLIAWSLFNDTYSFARGNYTLRVEKKEISWKSDREHKFAKNVYPSNFQNNALIGGKSLNTNIPLSEQEDLIVWMRTAALPRFRKLYGRIYADLKENDKIIVRLTNNYNTYSFGGKKKLVLSTATWLGGKNYFLGYAYLIVGAICIFLGFAFTFLYAIKPRKIGDRN